MSQVMRLPSPRNSGVPELLSHDRTSGTPDVRPGEALLAFGAAMPRNASSAVAIVNLSKSGDQRVAAARFFAALRTLDEKATAIAVVPIPEEGLGEAINDRLRRAAAPRR